MGNGTSTKGGWRTNKWFRAAIPGLLLHCSIGTVYCWSYVSEGIADQIGYSTKTVGWAFSLAILFLGLSAAFLGNVVEKDIHKSSLIATICFAAGMIGTGLFVKLGTNAYNGGAGTPSVLALIGIFVSYGFIMGIGLGTGYLSPVKTLMLWFEDRKGLATGLAVAGFGAAKAIGAPIMEAMQNNPSIGVVKMFYILAVVYFVMMFVGHLLLKKPSTWVEEHSDGGIKEFFATFGRNFKSSFLTTAITRLLSSNLRSAAWYFEENSSRYPISSIVTKLSLESINSSTKL